MLTTLRPYRPEDFQTLHAIDQTCYPPQIAYSRWDLRNYLQLPGAECSIAEVEGQPAGFILSAFEGRVGHLITIDVVEAFRRAGVGSTLLRAAEEKLRSSGVAVIVLETATNNSAAISFWRKHGYRTRGVLRGYYPGGIDAYEMFKFWKEPAPRAEET